MADWLKYLISDALNDPSPPKTMEELKEIYGNGPRKLSIPESDLMVDDQRAAYWVEILSSEGLQEEHIPILCCSRSHTYQIKEDLVMFYDDIDLVATVPLRVAKLFYFCEMHLISHKSAAYYEHCATGFQIDFVLPPSRSIGGESGQLKILTDIILAIDEVPASKLPLDLAVCLGTSAPSGEEGPSYRVLQGIAKRVEMYDPLHISSRETVVGPTVFHVYSGLYRNDKQPDLFLSDAYDMSRGIIVPVVTKAPYFSIKTEKPEDPHYKKDLYLQITAANEVRHVSRPRKIGVYHHIGSCAFCVELGFMLKRPLSPSILEIWRSSHLYIKCTLTPLKGAPIKVRQYYDRLTGVCSDSKRGTRPLELITVLPKFVRGRDVKTDLYVHTSSTFGDFIYAQRFLNYVVEINSECDYQLTSGSANSRKQVPISLIMKDFKSPCPFHLKSENYGSLVRPPEVFHYSRGLNSELFLGNKVLTLVSESKVFSCGDYIPDIPHPAFKFLLERPLQQLTIYQGVRKFCEHLSYKKTCEKLFNEYFASN